MKKATVGQLIAPTIICLVGIIIVTLISTFMYYFGDGPRLLGDFLIVYSPTIVLVIATLVSWRWQLIGGIIIATVGFVIAFIIPILFKTTMGSNEDTVSYNNGFLRFEIILGLMFIVSGALLMITHFRNKSTPE